METQEQISEAAGHGTTSVAVPGRETVILQSGATLAQAARALTNSGTSAVLVGADSHQIVTERDIVRGMAGGLGPTDLVEELATPAPLWVTPTSHISDAAGMMLRHGVRHLLVLRPTGEVAGLVSAEDFLPALAEGNPAELAADLLGSIGT